MSELTLGFRGFQLCETSICQLSLRPDMFQILQYFASFSEAGRIQNRYMSVCLSADPSALLIARLPTFSHSDMKEAKGARLLG